MPYLSIATGKLVAHCDPPSGFIVQLHSDKTITLGATDIGTIRVTAHQAATWVRSAFKVMRRVIWHAGLTELLGREMVTRRLDLNRLGSSFQVSVVSHSAHRSERRTRIILAHELRDFTSALIGAIEASGGRQSWS
jgi:hypothetical protein